MPGQIPPPSEVIVVVLASWLAGLSALGTATRAWGEVGQGHFKVVWLVATAIGGALGFLHRPGWVVALAAALTFALIYRKLDLAGGIATTLLALGSLYTAVAQDPVDAGVALAGAVLLGSVSNAMLLGHWHLNQPRLGTAPIKRLVRFLWVGLAAQAAAGTALAAASRQASPGGVAFVASLTGICFTVFAGVLCALVSHLVSARSIMSATGILYLQVLLCFVAVFTQTLATLAR